MAENRNLPGHPSTTLERHVRRVLRTYVQCRPPKEGDKNWRMTWEWASDIAQNSMMYQFGKNPRKKWPRPEEIASQYLLIAMLGMREDMKLRLHHHAASMVPNSVHQLVGRVMHIEDIVAGRKTIGYERKVLTLGLEQLQ